MWPLGEDREGLRGKGRGGLRIGPDGLKRGQPPLSACHSQACVIPTAEMSFGARAPNCALATMAAAWAGLILLLVGLPTVATAGKRSLDFGW